MTTKRVERATKLTPELQERICRYLRLGAYVETACKCVGVHKDTFYEWMKLGNRGRKPYAAFLAAVEVAMGESEMRDLAIVGEAAKKQWTAAAWRLERKFPDRYGRFDRMKVDAKVELDGAGLVAKLAKLIDGMTKEKGSA